MTKPVRNDQLRVTVEMGDGYEPSDQLASALAQLSAALSGDTQAEVEGFMGNFEIQDRSFSFDSLKLGDPGTTSKWIDKSGTGSWKGGEDETSWKLGH